MADKPLNPTPWVITTPHPVTREELKAYVEKQSQKGIYGKVEGADQTQIESAKVLIAELIDQLPEDMTHGVVRADGRVTNKGSQVHIYIDGSKSF